MGVMLYRCRDPSTAIAPGRFAVGSQLTLEGQGVLRRPWEPADCGVLGPPNSDPAIKRWHGRTLDEQEAAMWGIDERHAAWSREQGGDWAVVEAMPSSAAPRCAS